MPDGNFRFVVRQVAESSVTVDARQASVVPQRTPEGADKPARPFHLLTRGASEDIRKDVA